MFNQQPHTLCSSALRRAAIDPPPARHARRAGDQALIGVLRWGCGGIRVGETCKGWSLCLHLRSTNPPSFARQTFHTFTLSPLRVLPRGRAGPANPTSRCCAWFLSVCVEIGAWRGPLATRSWLQLECFFRITFSYHNSRVPTSAAQCVCLSVDAPSCFCAIYAAHTPPRIYAHAFA
jgi:hypothetical protein